MAQQIQESGEMYLEHIYVLEQAGQPVHSIDVARESGYSKPSVSRAVKLLREAGYLLVHEDGCLTLTDKGREVAHRMYERHTMLTRLFMKLGVPEEIASRDACKIEHDLSDVTFDALCRYANIKK